ncbi:hypothetical protein J6590_094434 [Homalodisca vitripennis]|nr:hypothetical protein J6590_094434 [Homalodisca vitripennis]
MKSNLQSWYTTNKVFETPVEIVFLFFAYKQTISLASKSKRKRKGHHIDGGLSVTRPTTAAHKRRHLRGTTTAHHQVGVRPSWNSSQGPQQQDHVDIEERRLQMRLLKYRF